MPFGVVPLYQTALGCQVVGDSLEMTSRLPPNVVDLVIANLPPEQAVDELFQACFRALKPSGSMVVNLRGRSPTSLLQAANTLSGPFQFAEDFYWVPRPAPVGPISRLKGLVESYWWLTKTSKPKSDPRRILFPYEEECCPEFADCPLRVAGEPCRTPAHIARYFVSYLTEPRDVVLDVRSGSNITGYVAERIGRRWLSIEPNPLCATASKARFASHRSTNVAFSKYSFS